jgi:hypothetical protein
MEQLARDARITTLYEGTTGIQALDLLGRKIMQLQGAGLRVFLDEVEAFCKAHEGDAALAEFIAPLRAKAAEWQALTQEIGRRASANPEEIGAAAHDYLFYSGYVALAYWWARSVATADASAQSQAFKDAKRETARFYFARLLPRTLKFCAARGDLDARLGRALGRGVHYIARRAGPREGPAVTVVPLLPRHKDEVLGLSSVAQVRRIDAGDRIKETAAAIASRRERR